MAEVDYSLFLGSDSTSAILHDQDLVEVGAALRGGATLVRCRDGVSDTEIVVSTARKLHDVTKKYTIPLRMNGRVDVSLAVGCEAVHIGQEDLDLRTARKLLGTDAMIVVTIAVVAEAIAACTGGANYVGAGPCVPLDSQTARTEEILRVVAALGNNSTTVSIGVMSTSKIQRALCRPSAPKKGIDGVAVVRATVTAADPKKAAAELLDLAKSPAIHGGSAANTQDRVEGSGLIEQVLAIIIAAELCSEFLAVGGSPIVASYGEEALVGTVTSERLMNCCEASKAYNPERGPVFFNPFGGGSPAVKAS
ncbi:hypothetical protein JHW43_005386 [Diplocarpon mali]|nr:hypothetical protein JHW43_005386 [Diplocarpon mali]